MPPTNNRRRKTPARSTYRHGDLRRALLESGIALAQTGGPDAVVLRAARAFESARPFALPDLHQL